MVVVIVPGDFVDSGNDNLETRGSDGGIIHDVFVLAGDRESSQSERKIQTNSVARIMQVLPISNKVERRGQVAPDRIVLIMIGAGFPAEEFGGVSRQTAYGEPVSQASSEGGVTPALDPA